MAILTIKKYPDPILKKKAKDVKEITPEIKKLAEDMIETMQKNEPAGVGLAAPQVGASKRIIVVQTNNRLAVFLNPKISKKSRETEILEEGCLSLPGVWLKIKRAKWVEVEGLDPVEEFRQVFRKNLKREASRNFSTGLDISGRKIKIKASGLLARIFQHEIDHLGGILITDRR